LDLVKKTDSLLIKKFHIKYGFVGNTIRNNFTHMNFSRFEIDFKLKFRESKV
jgi:hypothetical protein